MYAEQMLKCTSCKKLKSESEFYDYKHEHKCKVCISDARKVKYKTEAETIKAKRREYTKTNPDKIKYTKLKQTYGISQEEYDKKFAEQSGKCAICKKPETAVRQGKLMSLAMDHNHLTGENRDLLCVKCNRALGLLGENLMNLMNMIIYILKHLK